MRGMMMGRRQVCRYLVNWDEVKCACSARWPASVVRMIDAIHHRHFKKIEWAYSVQASPVYGIRVLVRSSLMMYVNPAARTEKVLP